MSPPTLVTLPRELRQHILFYAFEDAHKADLIFNLSLLLCSYKLPYDLCFDETYGISIDNLATTLIDALPELVDDVTFVPGKCLTALKIEESASIAAVDRMDWSTFTLDKWLELASLQ